MSKAVKDRSEDMTAAQTTKVEIHLHGRDYIVACDAGEEDKLASIVALVEKKMQDVPTRGTNNSETRMFMLTCLLLADELLETRRRAQETRKSDESLMVAAVEHLRSRVETIAAQVSRA